MNRIGNEPCVGHTSPQEEQMWESTEEDVVIMCILIDESQIQPGLKNSRCLTSTNTTHGIASWMIRRRRRKMALTFTSMVTKQHVGHCCRN